MRGGAGPSRLGVGLSLRYVRGLGCRHHLVYVPRELKRDLQPGIPHDEWPLPSPVNATETTHHRNQRNVK